MPGSMGSRVFILTAVLGVESAEGVRPGWTFSPPSLIGSPQPVAGLLSSGLLETLIEWSNFCGCSFFLLSFVFGNENAKCIVQRKGGMGLGIASWCYLWMVLNWWLTSSFSLWFSTYILLTLKYWRTIAHWQLRKWVTSDWFISVCMCSPLRGHSWCVSRL